MACDAADSSLADAGASAGGSGGPDAQGGGAGGGAGGNGGSGGAPLGGQPDARGGNDGGPVTDAGGVCDCPDDGDPCTRESCGADGACTHENDGTTCDDGTRCTTDRCVSGPVCPDGAAPVDGACLVALRWEEVRDWAGARAACQARGGDLPVIANADENTRARHAADVLCGEGSVAFLGLNDALAEGDFVWTDATPADYTNWADGEPRADAETQDYVALLPDGRWAVTAEPVGCVVCTADVEPFICLNEAADPAVVGEPETCNGEDDDCNGVVDDRDAAEFCDDANVCTDDVCLGADGCGHTEPVGRCDDGLACTVDTCEPVTGCMHLADDAACDDAVGCTMDHCDVMLGCVDAPVDAACDDGQACTTESCDVLAGCQYISDASTCSDGVECTEDLCRPFEGCVSEPRAALCSDGEVCTDDVCDPAAGGCVYPFNEAPCDDDDICTATSQCREGQCLGLEPTLCDDQVACTDGHCDPGLGCTYERVGVCDDPGDVAGYYEGPYGMTGSTSIANIGVRWECRGVMTATVDASRAVDLVGVSETYCTVFVPGGFDLLGYENLRPGELNGTIQGRTIDGRMRVVGRDPRRPDLEVQWRPTIEVDDAGVPVRITGANDAEIESLALVNVATTTDDLITQVFAGLGRLPSRFEATLDRVPIHGTCCLDAQTCEPSEDFDCYRKGWRFVADDAGRCCFGAECTSVTQRECAVVRGTFVPARYGACCFPGNASCQAMSTLLCEGTVGGVSRPGLSCGDDNHDGLVDACGVPAGFGYAASAVCTIERGNPVDGDRLVAQVGGGVTLALRSAWQATANGYAAGPWVVLETPLGDVEFPNVGALEVGCVDRFTFIGQAGAPPLLGGVSAWPNLGIGAELGVLTFGYAYGYEMDALDPAVEGPFADGRPYVFARADSGSSLSLGDDISLSLAGGNSFVVGVDPTDPAFVLSLGGDLLDNATGGFVHAIGFGMSYGGNLTWESALDLFDGEHFSPAIATGHIWRSGDFALLPIPGLPGNIDVEGELLVDLGDAVDRLEDVAKAVAAGSFARLESVLDPAEFASLVGQLRFSGNANRLYITLAPLDFEIGRGSFQLAPVTLPDGSTEGQLTFAGEGLTLGELLADGDVELFRALSTLTIRESGRTWGYIRSDRFHLTAEVDLAAGPFELEGVRLILDSVEGIRIEGGSVGFDYSHFLDVLETLMDCQFADGSAVCDILGVPAFALSGSFDEASGFRLATHVGLPILGEVDVEARIADSGDFALHGRAEAGIPGFNTQSADVTLTDAFVAVALDWNQFGTAMALTGHVGYDGEFSFSGTGATNLMGFPLYDAQVVLDSATGLHASGSMQVLPALGTEIGVEFAVEQAGAQWSLQGSGEMAPFGYRLGGVEVRATAGTEAQGLEVQGDLGLFGTGLRFVGFVRPNDFRLTATGALQIAGFHLASMDATLDASGLGLRGDLSLMGLADMRVEGRVETNGDFRLATNGDVVVPLFGLNVRLNGALEKRGWDIGAVGTASLDFAGLHFDGGFEFRSDGYFRITAQTHVEVDWWRIYGSGTASFDLSSGGAGAYFEGRLCVSVPVISDPCVGPVGGGINTDGTVRLRLPIVGWRTVDL